jgi:hypothetical protein
MSEISVTVVNSTTINPTVGNGDTVNVKIGSTGDRGPTGETGAAGPANTLTIGTVTQGSAAATITGTSPNQVLSLVLQKGDTGATGSKGDTGSVGPAGPANSLSIGTVTTGNAAATITGTAPNQVLNLVLQKGDTGSVGPQGPAGPPVNLADETPQPLGTASAGTALSAARADHVHAVPSIAYSSLTGIPSTFAPSAHSHAVSDVTGLQTALDGKQASGNYATLVGGTVPSAQLPSFVDDIIEYANLAAFTEQSTGKIYVARDTGKIYRWSGSAYVEISPSPGSTDSVTEGSVNLYYTNARAAAAAPVQSVAGRTGTVTLTKSDVGLGSVLNVDATLRSVHYGTQLASTISDFATEAAKYAPVTSVAGRTGAVTLAKADVGLGSVLNVDATLRSTHYGTQLASTISDFATEAAKYGPVTSVNGQTGAVTVSGGGSSYTLPTATSSVLGGIKVGSGLTITDGVLAATGGGGSGLTWSPAPASASATGTAGQIAYDGDYFYVAVGNNQWERAALSTWTNFTPATIAGLQAWYDASDASTLYDATSGGSLVAAGGAVARWQDKSGNGRHATQATSGSRPIRKSNQRNGLDALLFDGTNDMMSFNPISIPASHSVYQVYERQSGVQSFGIAGSPVSNRYAALWFSDGVLYQLGNNGGDFTTHGAASSATGYFLVSTIRVATTSISLRRNAVNVATVTTGAGVTDPASGEWALIGDRTDGNFHSGNLCEIIVYDSALSDTNRGLVESYLMQKWAIT